MTRYRLLRVLAFALLGALPACQSSGSTDDAGPPGPPFIVDFATTAGPFSVQVDPSWAPRGARRLRELVEAGFYDDARFFRVVPGFVAQFGIAADPGVSAAWRDRRIDDDPVTQSNVRGTLTFATSGPDTRTTQLFINYGDNSFLDSMGFSPIGRVTEGMDAADAIYAEHGEAPLQSRYQSEGNAYLDDAFPELTAIESATIR